MCCHLVTALFVVLCVFLVRTQQANVQPRFEVFAEAVSRTGRQMQLGVWILGFGRPWTWVPQMNKKFGFDVAPHFRVTNDIGNLWAGYGGPTMGVITTVDVIQQVPDLYAYGVASSNSIIGTFPNYGQMTVGVPPDHQPRPNHGRPRPDAGGGAVSFLALVDVWQHPARHRRLAGTRPGDRRHLDEPGGHLREQKTRWALQQ